MKNEGFLLSDALVSVFVVILTAMITLLSTQTNVQGKQSIQQKFEEMEAAYQQEVVEIETCPEVEENACEEEEEDSSSPSSC